MKGVCPEFYKQQQWARLGFDSKEAWFKLMDPNALLAMARKWRRGDSSVHANNNLQRALQRIRAITYMIAFEKDMFVPPADMALEQQYIGNSEMKVIPSLMGHFAMLELLEEDFNVINDLFAELLSINI